MEITVTYYWVTYEFTVDGVCYTGHGSSKWKKRVGKRIKIFYDKEMPQKTETAEHHKEVPRVLVIIAVIAVGMFYLLDKIS